jgi:Cu-Zn family superoxide dismutase
VKYVIQGLLVCAIALLTTLVFNVSDPQVAYAQGTATSATAIIRSTDGSDTVLGEATFNTTPEGMKIDVFLSGVSPGFHGFHVHEFNSCDDGGNAAGGHFNPRHVKHGYLLTDGYDAAHVGDLGNIVIYADGTGDLSLTVPGLPLLNDDRAIAGHAVILHADRDDFGQPTGNAGGRIGCGIIDVED